MKKLLTYVLIFVLLSCGAIDSKKDYKILSEEEGSFNKVTLYIELPKEKNKAELEHIAKELRRDRKEYDKVWIFYHLPGMERGRGAWATTHFSPELEVQIIGNTEEQKKEITTSPEIPDPATIIGQWYEPQVTRMGFALIEKDGRTFMRMIMPNGVNLDREVKEKKEKELRRFDEVETNAHSEYYILEKDGSLGLYGRDGRFALATKVKS
jgi:hypothetical protein